MQKIKFYHGLISSFKSLRKITPLTHSTRFTAPYTHSTHSSIFSHNSPYAQFSSNRSFMSEIDDIIDIDTGKKPTGRLVICPTPIGNIRDISIRQYEALLECDIIACEDTRNTGKLYKMFKEKRIKEKFYEKFEIDLNEVKDVTIDDFGSKDEEEFFDNLEEPESVKKARKILNGLDSLGFMGRNEEMDDESMYGLEDQFILSLKKKIKEVREKKGRGLMISYYKDNEDRRVAKLIKCLQYNFEVALVSDAGTPTISDPGYKLVNEAHKQNINVESLPGPSVVSVALSSSGFPSDRFMFEGYASKTPAMKVEKLETIRDMEITCVLFESKARVMKTLIAIEKVFGENQMVSVGFEFTKMYEALFRGRVKEVFERLEKEEKERELKGEITIVIAPHSPSYNTSLKEKSPLDEEKVKNAEGLYTVNVEQLVKVMQDKLEAGDKQMALLLVDMLGISKNKAMQHISKVKYPESPLAKKVLGF